MKGIPEIRFNTSNIDWTTRKLSDFCRRIVRKNSSLESDLVLTISAQYGLIIQGEFFNKRIASSQIENYYLIKKGEFAYNKSYSSEYPVGAVKPLKKYDKGVLSTLYIIFSICTDDVDPKWLSNYFETNYWHYEILKRASEGARNHGLLNISAEDFFDIPITMPTSKQEQTAIGKFFDDLDEYISSQALELQKLKNIKKACLEKMFPKEGELVPEIRFDGFEGNWVIKTLGELFTKVTEKNIDNSLTETFTNSAQEGIISQRDYFNHDISNIENINGYYVVRPDDFVYNPRMSVTAPVGPINRNKLLRSGVMSPLYSVFRAKDERTDLTFLEYFFKTDKWYNFMWKNGDNGARGDRFSIRDEVFQLLPIIIPPSKKEQISIANYFLSLDKFICSTSNKLDKLKQIRKGLLEKMFVANN